MVKNSGSVATQTVVVHEERNSGSYSPGIKTEERLSRGNTGLITCVVKSSFKKAINRGYLQPDTEKQKGQVKCECE